VLRHQETKEDVLAKRELRSLRTMDHKKNLDIEKEELQEKKLRVLMKHQAIDQNLSSVKKRLQTLPLVERDMEQKTMRSLSPHREEGKEFALKVGNPLLDFSLMKTLGASRQDDGVRSKTKA